MNGENELGTKVEHTTPALVLTNEEAGQIRTVFDQAGSLTADLNRTMSLDTKISLAELLASEADKLLKSGTDLNNHQMVDANLQDILQSTNVLPDSLMNLGWDGSVPSEDQMRVVKTKLPEAIRYVAITSKNLRQSEKSLLDTVKIVSDLAKTEMERNEAMTNGVEKRRRQVWLFDDVIKAHTVLDAHAQDTNAVDSKISDSEQSTNSKTELENYPKQMDKIIDQTVNEMMRKKANEKQTSIVDFYADSYRKSTENLITEWKRYLAKNKRGTDVADITLFMKEMDNLHADDLKDAPFIEDFMKNAKIPRAEEGTVAEQFVVTGSGWSETITANHFREGNVNQQEVEFFHRQFLSQMTQELLGINYDELRKQVVRGEYHGGGQYHKESKQLQFVPTKVQGVYLTIDFENEHSMRETHSVKLHYTPAYLSSLLLK